MNWIIAVTFMLLLTIFDIRKKEIPALWLLLFGAVSFIYVGLKGEKEWIFVVYSLIPGAFFLALSLCTKESVGYGDGWTVLALGVLIGLRQCFAVVFTGLVFSAVFSLIMLVLRKVNGKSRLPFLPFITMGLGVTMIVQGVF